MATKIYKYELAEAEVQAISVPGWIEPLSVQLQGGKICLWAKVDPDKPAKAKLIYIVGTGDRAPWAEFVGTVQRGPYVWHVFVGGDVT